MPDFDTRKPQGTKEPSRLRIPLIINRLRSLLIATRLRTLLIGGGILLFVGVAVPIGLLIYPSSSGTGNQQEALGEAAYSRIVFTLDGDIWIMNADGSDPKQLTDTTAREEAPVWSPDGVRIAFTRVVYEYGDGRTSATSSAESKAGPSEVPYLFVMNADGSDQNQLLESHAGDPAWSPDGQKIAFSAMDQNGWSDIYVTDADGSGTPRKLTTEPSWEHSPAWSPDGKYIAFESGRHDGRQANDYADIYVMKACCVEGDTNQPQRLTDNPGWNRDPEWSPDGTEIAFTHVDFGSAYPRSAYSAIRNTDIYTIDADGSETRLTHTDSEQLPEHSPAWSPSGDKIVFLKGGYYELSRSAYSSAIYVMETDGSNPTFVKDFGRMAGSPDWIGTAQRAIADEGAGGFLREAQK